MAELGNPLVRLRRRLVAALATAAVWVPLAVALIERHVTALAERAQPTDGLADPIDAPLEMLNTGHPWIWLAVAAVLMLVWRRDPRRWAVPALLAGVAVPYTSHLAYRPGVAELDGVWGLIGAAPTGTVVALTAAVTVGVTWLGAHLSTSPLGADIAGGRITLPLPRRGRAGKLTLRDDELVLAARPYELVLPWASISLVQAGTLTHDTEWVQPHGTRVTLPAGPALRVVGAAQQWVVPVTDAVTALQVVESRRARSGGALPPAPDPQRWRTAERLVIGDNQRQRRMAFTVAGYSPHFWLLGGSVCLLLAAVSVVNVTDPGWRPGFLLGTAFYGGFGSIALYLGLRVRAARRLLSRWPKPPGEGHSTTDPAVPVAGWTPALV